MSKLREQEISEFFAEQMDADRKLADPETCKHEHFVAFVDKQDGLAKYPGERVAILHMECQHCKVKALINADGTPSPVMAFLYSYPKVEK